MNQILICRTRTIRIDRTSLKPKKAMALRSSNSPVIKDREGAVEEVHNRDGSKLVTLAEDNRHKTLGRKEIVRAIKITDTIRKIVARGTRMVVQGITSRMTEAERASISIKIMEVSSTIMKEARTIKVARYR